MTNPAGRWYAYPCRLHQGKESHVLSLFRTTVIGGNYFTTQGVIMENEQRGDRLIVLLLVGVLALNFPILALFDKPTIWLGIPVLYLYLFISWLIFICLLAAILSKRSRTKSNSGIFQSNKTK